MTRSKRNTEFGLRSLDCGVWIAEFGLRSLDWRVIFRVISRGFVVQKQWLNHATARNNTKLNSCVLSKWLTLALCLALLTALTATLTQAQYVIGLSGVVSDQNGARLPNATVRLTNEKGFARYVTTDDEGNYTMRGLEFGRYTITAEAEGFSVAQEQVEIVSEGVKTLNFTLSVKLVVKEPVVVPVAQNDLAAITLSGDKIQALPSNPRRLLLHLKRLAGATGPGDTLTVYVDGVRETGPLPPKEIIQSIRINQDSFAAEFSEPGRGRVAIITKPATEDWHGELDFNFNDESLNARNPFALNRPAEQLRTYDLAFGGPFIKNRWGYFVSWERRAQEENSIINATALNPVTFTAQPFAATLPRPTHNTDFLARTNYLLREGQTLDFRYRYNATRDRNQGLDDGFSLPSRAFDRTQREDTFRLAWLSVISETAVNEAFIELGRRRNIAQANTTATTTTAGVAPGVEVLDTFTGGGHPDAAGSTELARNLSLQNNFTLSRGTHTLKFGGQASATQSRSKDRTNFNGSFTFGTDLLRDARGLPRLVDGAFVVISPLERYANTVQRLTGYRASQFTIRTGDPFVGLTQWETGFFAQDDWQLKPRMTVSYGLRSELQTHLADKLNLAPRLSLAVQPFKQSDAVLRVGAGLFYERFAPELSIETNRFDGVRQQDLLIQRPGFFAVIPQVFNPALTQLTLHTKAADLNAPYALLSSVSYEQPLAHGLSASVSYSFQRGTHLLRTRNLNAPISGTRPNIDVGPILQYESTGRSRRHEFDVALNGEINDKFTFYGSYRLSSTRSDTDGPFTAPANSYNLATEWGRSALDQRHQFYFESYLLLPFGLAVTPNLFVASGAPFDITTGSDDNGDSFFTDRPTFAASGGIATPYGLLNPTPSATETIIPRNFGRGPNEISLNLNLSRTLNFGAEMPDAQHTTTGRAALLRRHYALTLSMDVYNLLNRTNLGQFNGILGTSLFGRANYAEDARRVNVGVSLAF